MSDLTNGRERHFYLDDMIGFCERVLAFTFWELKIKAMP